MAAQGDLLFKGWFVFGFVCFRCVSGSRHGPEEIRWLAGQGEPDLGPAGVVGGEVGSSGDDATVAGGIGLRERAEQGAWVEGQIGG